MELNEIPTPISDAIYEPKPSGSIEYIGEKTCRDLERHLAAAMKWVYACQIENQNRADMIASYEKLTAPNS